MKTIKLIGLSALCFAFSYTSFSQQVQKVKAGYGVAITQTEPEYPGGLEALGTFLHENLQYPPEMMQSKMGGRVMVIFIVDKDGKIVDPTILKGVNESVNEEALRLVRLMPNWKPGTVGGTPVNKQYILPIDFVIPSSVL